MQADKVWSCLVISNPVASLSGYVPPPHPTLDASCSPPWWEPWEKSPQRRRDVGLESAQKETCISSWGNVIGKGETLSAP